MLYPCIFVALLMDLCRQMEECGLMTRKKNSDEVMREADANDTSGELG